MILYIIISVICSIIIFGLTNATDQKLWPTLYSTRSSVNHLYVFNWIFSIILGFLGGYLSVIVIFILNIIYSICILGTYKLSFDLKKKKIENA